jgi:hypothetical protein
VSGERARHGTLARQSWHEASICWVCAFNRRQAISNAARSCTAGVVAYRNQEAQWKVREVSLAASRALILTAGVKKVFVSITRSIGSPDDGG